MAYQPIPGSIVSFQSNPSVLQATVGLNSTNASVITVGTAVANQSVSGTVGASVIGVAPVRGTASVGATAGDFPIIIGGIDTNGNAVRARFADDGDQIIHIHSSIIALVDNAPNQVAIPRGQDDQAFLIYPNYNYAFDGSTWDRIRGNATDGLFVNVTGSVATTGGDTIASVVAFQPNPSVLQTLSGLMSTNASVITVGGATGNSSVMLLNSAAVIGSVAALQGTNPWTVRSSITGGIFPVSGSVAAVVTNTVPVTNVGSTISLNIGSVISVTQGSVAAVVTNTVPVTNVGSIISLNIGSVISVTQGSVAATVINIPQTSVHGTVKIFPASVVSGHGSVNGAASVQVLAAPGAGLYNYVTDFFVSNTGAATTLVTFTDGDGSVMGKTIAPTGGGSNGQGMSAPMRTLQTNKVVNIVAATATSVLHAWVGGYKGP